MILACYIVWKNVILDAPIVNCSPPPRSLSVPECDSQSAALSKQPHALLQLYHAVSVCRGQCWSHSRADHQGLAGEADCEQATPVGSAHHLHRADQEPCLQVLEPWFCALRPRDREVVPVSGSVLYGAEAGPAGDGGNRCQLSCRTYSRAQRERSPSSQPFICPHQWPCTSDRHTASTGFLLACHWVVSEMRSFVFGFLFSLPQQVKMFNVNIKKGRVRSRLSYFVETEAQAWAHFTPCSLAPPSSP